MNDHGTHLNASKKYPGTISENLPVKKKKRRGVEGGLARTPKNRR